MALDRPVTGWGLGSYRFLFPVYQQVYPKIVSEHGRRLYFDHAHCDYLELFAELGAAGLLILLAGGTFALWRLVRLRFWTKPLAACIVAGLATTLLHAAVDFPFYNVATFGLWLALLVAVLRWLELSREQEAAGR